VAPRENHRHSRHAQEVFLRVDLGGLSPQLFESELWEPIDVRVISATNIAPKALADQNLIRQDLLYRINTVETVLPRLRERREDIPLFLEHFIAIYAQKYNFPVKRRSAAALDRLMTYHWPDNVRSLRHAVGSGVGLILVRQIATAHGACVDVAQTPGGGATVRLRF
jgi:transcriptional regulator with PAS, ATPase and Fis domain